MQGEGGWDFMLHPLAFSQLGSSGNPNIFNGTSALNTTGTTFGECVSEGNRALTGLFIAAGMCVLYFLYTWGNSLFCRHNGLCGLLDRKTPDSQHISVLMDHCKEILSAKPFEIYRVVEMDSPGSGWGYLFFNNIHHYVRTLFVFKEVPWPWPCPTRCFSEQAVAVRATPCLATCFKATPAGDTVIAMPPDAAAAAAAAAAGNDCWYNVDLCSSSVAHSPWRELRHTTANHDVAVFPAAAPAGAHFTFKERDQFTMVVSLSAADNKWAVKVGECSTTAWVSAIAANLQIGAHCMWCRELLLCWDFK